MAMAGDADVEVVEETNLAAYVMTGLIVLALVAACAAHGSWPRGLEATFLAVGNADCAVVRTPGGRVVLIDGGRHSNERRSPAAVLPYLMEKGISFIDAIIVTAGTDKEKMGAVPSVLNEVDAGAVYMLPELRTTDYGRKLRTTALTLGIPLRDLADGQRFHLGSRGFVDVRVWRAEEVQPAVGVRLSHGEARAWVFNSLTKESAKLVASALPGPADVLKLAEQGEFGANPPEVIEAVSPEFAIISRGLQKGASDSTPVRVTEQLKRLGVKVLRTDVAGAVTVELRSGRVSVSSFRDQ